MKRIIRKIACDSGLQKSLPPNDEIIVNFVDDQTISTINQRYLAHPGPTDVITFNYCEDSCREWSSPSATAGEIFVSWDAAQRAAIEFATTVEHEIILYLIHGILHLQGYDDQTTKAKLEMRTAEEKLIARIRSDFQLAMIFSAVD